MITLDNLTIDGAEIGWFGINTQKHRVSSHGKPTIIQNSTIRNLRTAPAKDPWSGTAIAWTGTGGEIAGIPPWPPARTARYDDFKAVLA